MPRSKYAFVGADPGAKGAMCLLIPETKQIAFMDNSAKPLEILGWLERINNEYNLKVIMIEDVHAIFGTSAKSNFNFGFNTGLITGIIQASGNSLDKVTPKVWQKYVGVKQKGKLIKKEVGEICDRLYPNTELRGSRGGLLDGRSDALCIAVYAAHKWG